MTTNAIFALAIAVMLIAIALLIYNLIRVKRPRPNSVSLRDSEAFILQYEWVKWLAETSTIEKGHAVFILHQLHKLDLMPGKDTDRMKELRYNFEHRFAEVIGGV